MDIKKPLGVGYGFKSNCVSINESLFKLKGCCQYRRQNQKWIFPPFGNDFFPSLKNIILKRHPILYPLKTEYICEYNPRYLMSSGLVFDYIIMNILRNKALECHVQVGDSYFTNTENKIIYRGSLQDFYWKKGTHESIDFYVHISMSKEKK